MADKKATNINVDKPFLDDRIRVAAIFENPKAKWISFCEYLLARGYKLSLYEARQTVSKYITVTKNNSPKKFKVRFSNHKPIQYKEDAGDCDFFVGVSNNKVTNTQDAIKAVLNHFEGNNAS